MLIRSVLAGIVMALLLASSMTNGVMDWLLGTQESYLFGSVVDTITPSVVGAIGVEPFVQFAIRAVLMGIVAAGGAMLWQVAERLAVGCAAGIARLKGTAG